MKNLILMILLIGSSNLIAEEKGEYDMTCNWVKERMSRCENKEVICYRFNGESMQCKFKDK